MAKGTTETTKKAQKQGTIKKVEKKQSKATTKVARNTSPNKKNIVEKTVTKKTTSAKKSSSKNISTKKSNVTKNKTEKFQVIEYYDLPYRYNQTTVKILAQTPTTLFVYWDISDEDRNTYIEQFGETFFNSSKPVLIIHNLTNQTSFEVEINDFANSWYLKMTEPNCKYEIELGRRIIKADELKINNDKNTEKMHYNSYISITNSNNLETPNDHVLLENIHIGTKIQFRNVKTNEITTKEYGTFTFMPNIYKLFDFYKTIYQDEIMEDNHKAILSNPSSSSFFK